MASMTLTSIFTKPAYTGDVVAGKTWSSKAFIPITLCPVQASFRHESNMSRAQQNAAIAAKQSANEAKKAGHELKNKASSTGIYSNSSTYTNVDHLFGVEDIGHFLFDDAFIFRDRNGDKYSIYFDTKNKVFEINNDHSFLNELESPFSSYPNSGYLNHGSDSDNPYYDHYMDDTQSSWNNHINSCIDSYLNSELCIDDYNVNNSDNHSDSYIYRSIYGENGNSSKEGGYGIRNTSDLTRRESYNNLDVTQKYRHLWVQCEKCYGLNYKKILKSKMNICEQCGHYLKLSSSDRIELLVDEGTWDPMNEDMVSLDPIEFHSEEEPYKDRLDSYQRKTGLTEAVQTGIGQLNDIPVAIGVMDFQFMGGVWDL